MISAWQGKSEMPVKRASQQEHSHSKQIEILDTTGTVPAVQTAGGVMTPTVPSIRDHEVIAIGFA